MQKFLAKILELVCYIVEAKLFFFLCKVKFVEAKLYYSLIDKGGEGWMRPVLVCGVFLLMVIFTLVAKKNIIKLYFRLTGITYVTTFFSKMSLNMCDSSCE